MPRSPAFKPLVTLYGLYELRLALFAHAGKPPEPSLPCRLLKSRHVLYAEFLIKELGLFMPHAGDFENIKESRWKLFQEFLAHGASAGSDQLDYLSVHA